MKTEITLNIDLTKLARSLDEEDAIELINEIDLRFGSCDFTLNVLNKLIKSLKKDMSIQDIKIDLHELNSQT